MGNSCARTVLGFLLCLSTFFSNAAICSPLTTRVGQNSKKISNPLVTRELFDTQKKKRTLTKKNAHDDSARTSIFVCRYQSAHTKSLKNIPHAAAFPNKVIHHEMRCYCTTPDTHGTDLRRNWTGRFRHGVKGGIGDWGGGRRGNGCRGFHRRGGRCVGDRLYGDFHRCRRLRSRGQCQTQRMCEVKRLVQKDFL